MRDLKDALSEIALKYGWGFEYARRDFQNLVDVSEWVYSTSENYDTGETYMMVDPIVRRPHGTGVIYSGSLMILTNSDLDKKYDDKFEHYIRPLLSIVLGGMKSSLLCEFDVLSWRTMEVINFFDFNADGIVLQYELKGY